MVNLFCERPRSPESIVMSCCGSDGKEDPQGLEGKRPV
jgi:hypothetical protein